MAAYIRSVARLIRHESTAMNITGRHDHRRILVTYGRDHKGAYSRYVEYLLYNYRSTKSIQLMFTPARGNDRKQGVL